MERLRRLKKGLAYLLSMALVVGGFYTNSLRANAEGEASVSQIWATFQEGSEPNDYEIANSEPKGKGLYAKVINGGTYKEQVEADKELLLYVNNAEVTSNVRDQNSLFFVRLAGNSSLQASNFTVSSSTDVFPAFTGDITAENLVRFFESKDYTGEPDGQGGWNPSKPYSYEFTAGTQWINWTGMDKLTVKSGATLTLTQSYDELDERYVPAIIEVQQAAINGTVSLSETTIEEPNAFVVLNNGSLTVSNNGKLEGNGNSYLEIRQGATVSGIKLYDTNGINEFSDFSNTESFHWKEDKWVRNNPGSAGEGGESDLSNNQYRVHYDNRGGESNASVLVNNVNVNDNALQKFTKGETLTFQLNPPEDRADKTPVVAIYVNVNGVDTVYRTNPGEGEKRITLIDNNSKFTFTPTTDDPFEVFIDWSEYDAFGETEEKPIIVEVECEATENCPVTAEGIAGDDKMIDGNRMKVRVASATKSITLNWIGDDPREIKVEGGSSYTNFTKKSQEIELPTTNENNTFYRVVLDFHAQEGGNGNEGGNPGSEGGQSRPQSPELVKANKGEIVINVSGPTQGGVLYYRIGNQDGYTNVQPDELPLKLDGLKLAQNVVVQIGFTTSGRYQFDDMQGNTIQIDDKAPTNIDLDQLGKRTFVVTYNPEEAVTIDIKTMESQPQGGQFDGTAYLFWEGNNKQICKYKFDNLSTSQKEGEGENVIDVYDVNFVKASDIKDAATGDVFSITKKFEFVYSNMVDDSRTQHLFDGQLSSEDDKHAITMDPTNNTKGQTSVTWTPDRAFRITFYEEGYQGICLVTSGMDYPEAPFNETVFGIKDKDIGGTTKENPAILPVYGLEQSITVKAGDNSKPIKEITPLDVPNGAITVSEIETGVFNIEFHSNFYDKVVYQVTDKNDKVYYVRIIRETLQAHDNFGPETPESDMKITADFYFPISDSYSKYQMVASLWVQDENGQNVIKEVKVVQPGIVEDMDGESTGKYEVPIGANPTLKQSSYIVPVDDSIVAISFNIVKTGEMNSNTFSGAVSGSGDGAYYDIEARRIIYDNVKEGQN